MVCHSETFDHPELPAYATVAWPESDAPVRSLVSATSLRPQQRITVDIQTRTSAVAVDGGDATAIGDTAKDSACDDSDVDERLREDEMRPADAIAADDVAGNGLCDNEQFIDHGAMMASRFVSGDTWILWPLLPMQRRRKLFVVDFFWNSHRHHTVICQRLLQYLQPKLVEA